MVARLFRRYLFFRTSSGVIQTLFTLCHAYSISYRWCEWHDPSRLISRSYRTRFFITESRRYPTQYYFWKMRIWFGTQEDPVLYHSSCYCYLILRSLYTTFNWSKMRYTSAGNILFLISYRCTYKFSFLLRRMMVLIFVLNKQTNK